MDQPTLVLPTTPLPKKRDLSFRDIPVAQKLIVIAAILLLPMLLANFFLVIQNQQDINFRVKERLGVTYLASVRQLQFYLQESRLHATNAAQGDTAAMAKLDEALKSFDTALTELQGLSQIKGDLGIDSMLENVELKWSEIVPFMKAGDILKMTATTQQFTKDLLIPLYQQIADASNLTLDPDLDTYYLMSLVSVHMPLAFDRIGALRTVGRTVIGDGIVTVEERSALNIAFSESSSAAGGLFDALERSKAASEFVTNAVTDTESQANEAVYGLINSFEKNIVDVETPTITFDEASALKNPRPLLYDLYDVSLSTLDSLLETRVRGLQRQFIFILAAVALSLLIASLVVFWINGLITRSLKELTSVSERLAKGDLSQEAKIDAYDEIGMLGESLNNAIIQLRLANERQEAEISRGKQLQQNIGSFLETAMDIAQGDLTKRGKVSEDALGNVVDAINLMVEEIGYTLKDAQQTTQSVNKGAGDMFATADLIAQSAQHQSREAQKARVEVESISSSIQQMAQTANTSADAAERTLKASQEGRQAVTETLEGMQDIRREVQAISKRIKSLGDRSLEISEIVDTISRISRQTNLLALNAAIEASGAGEAGSRFAVVADEVRKLAEDSAQSTQRVSGLIKAIQTEVQEVVVSVESGTKEVEAGYKVAAQAGQRLEEISTIAQQTAEFARVISRITTEQVDRVEQVGQVVEQMAEISAKSQDTVIQGRETAEQLQTLASRLSENIARFRVA